MATRNSMLVCRRARAVYRRSEGRVRMREVRGRVVRGGVSVVASVVVVLGVGCAPDPQGRAQQALGDGITYEPDCTEPEAGSRACIHPTRAIIEHAQSLGYPYYIGHAESTAPFFSRTGSPRSALRR